MKKNRLRVHHHKLSISGIILLLISLPCGTSFGQPSAEPVFKPGPVGDAGRDRLAGHLEAIRSQYGFPSMAAAVIVDGKPILVAAVGERKLKSGVMVADDDLFHLGSCTKAMTAFLIERLVDEGHFRHESRIRALCPKLSPYMHRQYATLTLEHCLAHRGGFVGTDDTFDRIPRSSLRLEGMRARFDYLKRMLHREPLDPIGTRYRYSNVGHTLAAYAAEYRMKRPWETLMEDYVYEPLGMTTVGYGAAGTARKIDQPWPHKFEREEQKPVTPGPAGDNAELIGPAARAHCSMSDWAKFAAEILRTAAPDQHAGKALLGAAAAKRLVTPPYERGRYAGGWSVYHNRVYGNVLSHDGSNTLNHASALLVPGKRFAILVATNTGHRLAKQACSLVQYRIAADWLFGGMDSASLSREPYRANNVRQWIARIQNNLIDRSRRYLTTELYEFLTSDEGRELKETLAKQGAFQRIQFVARQKEDGAEFGIYRVTFERAEWLVEYEADTRRVTQRLRFRMISPARR